MGATGGVRIEWAGADAATLRRIRPAWLELANRVIEPNPFFEPVMLEPAVARYAALGRAALLLVWRGSTLIGLLPVAPRPMRRLPRLELGVTTALHPHSYLATPLVAADDAAAAVDGLLDGLDRDVPLGLAWLDGYDGAGLFARLLAERCLSRGQPNVVLAREERALLRPAAGGHEHYLEQVLDRRQRRDLERRRRGLAAEGRLTLRTLDGDAMVFAEAFLALEARGWKGAAGTAMACSAADAGFLRDLVEGLAAQGRLRGHALLLDEAWIAVGLDIAAGDGCFAFKTTFDERYRRFAPGKLLEIEIIRTAHDPGGPVWFDSCTAPDNAMLGKLWRDRRTIERRVVAGRGALSRLLLRLIARRCDDPRQQAQHREFSPA